MAEQRLLADRVFGDIIDQPPEDPRVREGLVEEIRRLLEAARKTQVGKRDAFVGANRLSVAARLEVSNSTERHVEAERAVVYQAEFGDDEDLLLRTLARIDQADRERQAAHELAERLVARANDAQDELKRTTSEVDYIAFLVEALGPALP